MTVPSFQRGLVLGGSGFIGRHLARCGLPMVVTARTPPQGGAELGFDARQDSLAQLLATSSRSVSHVFIAFAIANIEDCAQHPEDTAAINVEATKRVIDDALAAGLVPVFLSSDYVFDGSRGLWGDDDPANPVTEYGRQKLAIERYLASLSVPWLALRLSKVVGDTGEELLGELIRGLTGDKPVRCARDQVFSPIDIGDLVACVSALVTQKARGLFNLGGPDPYSRLELAELLAVELRHQAPATTPLFQACSLRDFPFRELRPLNTSLASERIRPYCRTPMKRMPEVCRTAVARHLLRIQRHTPT